VVAKPPESAQTAPIYDTGYAISNLTDQQKGGAKQQQSIEQARKETQALVDKYRAKPQEGKRAGILPISLSFPTFGPSIFLVSELTAENQAPTVEINYEGNKKGGAK
jgi:hypothetical protein